MYIRRRLGADARADIAQLVEYKLPKLGVAGSNPVVRSKPVFSGFYLLLDGRTALAGGV